MKNILTESFKSNFKTLPNKPANVLKRIQGVLSDFKSNRNGRIYPRELWENVLASDYVKEMIENHGLVGELDHPEERLEISLQNVSHVINDMWIEGDQVMGVIDILPTPSGKIVNELLDYGTDIGISSRGAGSVGSGNIVDPDYQFITFDFVARPSCAAARLNTILEGVQYEIDNNSDDKVNAILESYKGSLKEGTFGEEVGFSEYTDIDQLKNDFIGILDKALNDGKESSVTLKTMELHRGMSWVDNNPWIRAEVSNIEDYTVNMLEKNLDKFPVCKQLGIDNINFNYYNGIEMGKSFNIKEYKGIRTFIDMEPHYNYDGDITYEDLEEETKLLEDLINQKVSEVYDELLNLLLSEEYSEDSDDLTESENKPVYLVCGETPTITNVVVEVFRVCASEEQANEIVSEWNQQAGSGEYWVEEAPADYKAYIKENRYRLVGNAGFDLTESAKDGWLTQIIVNGELQYENRLSVEEINTIMEKAIEIKPLGKEFYGESLKESVLSDQEVYKTVLGWYKEQIEAGNMTLNQAYELLSDKAKVSLNKMVDQNMIKESILRDTIAELLNESIELNK